MGKLILVIFIVLIIGALIGIIGAGVSEAIHHYKILKEKNK